MGELTRLLQEPLQIGEVMIEPESIALHLERA